MTPTDPNEPMPGPSHAGPDGPPLVPGWTLRAAVRVVELRLRFVALMAATGLVLGYWDTLAGHLEKWRRPAGGEAREAASRVAYFCPMHPAVVDDAPGHCPTCGMPLARRVGGTDVASTEGASPRVRLTPGRVAQAGVRTVAVGLVRLEERLRTVGYVGFDEGRRFRVASNARGQLRVDRLLATSEGLTVRAGQKLAELYGYDLSQAIRQYRDARAAGGEGAGSPGGPGAAPATAPPGDPEDRIALAAEALRVLGARQDQIDAIAAGGPSAGLLPVLAPIDGQVVRKYVIEGQYVPEGEPLFDVADLGRVWIVAQVFEDQLGRVEVGRGVEAEVPAFPGEAFPGRVAMIAPALDPATRTAAVRFELDNPGHRLRPGMFATVTLGLAPAPPAPREQATCPVTGLKLNSMGGPVPVEVAGRTLSVCCPGCVPKLESDPGRYLAAPGASPGDAALAVPESAVIDTGSRQVVYVEVGPGVFEGRAVTLGPRSGDRYPVLAGLSPGDRVAAAGAFLIDAESRLNPATTGPP
nr:efflux RND transporter periplasmic adaptor subunit [Aquisphaera giovannonii]